MKIRFRINFEQRLLLAFLLLLAVSSGASILASKFSSSTYFTQSLNQNIATGREVVDVYLDNQATQLATSVAVLVNDWGFKSAVATNDMATIDGVLLNHAARIGADLAILSDLDGTTLSATEQLSTEFNVDPGADLSAVARIQEIGGALYQTLTLPVEVPDHIAWITMAFQLDQSLVADLAQITNLDVSFVQLGGSSYVTSRATGDPSGFLNQPTMADMQRVLEEDTDYVSALSQLEQADSSTYLLLQASTGLIDQASSALLNDLLTIFAGALVLCLLVSMWFARKISNPVGLLVAAAKRIRGGDYETAVEGVSGGELALLGGAMNDMMHGIAEREAVILRRAYTEPVTGLANKTRFLSLFDDNEVPDFCLGLISVLDFKDINFSYGEMVGQSFKVAVGQRLQELVGPDQGQVFAFNSVELAVLLPAVEVKRAQLFLTEVVKSLHEPYQLQGWQVTSRFAGAVVSYPQDADDIDLLVHRARATLDRAVLQKASALTYLAEEEETRHRQLKIIASFETALSEDQFHLCFQPKITVQDGGVAEAEVLLRWIHPELGFIPPDDFILLAERSGNMQRITAWVLTQTVQQAATWAAQGFNIKLAVNISAHDLMSLSLPAQILQLLKEHGATGEMFTIEVTESAVLEDEKRAIEALVRLKRMGITLSIDDFGTGFSSLAQLKNLPVDELKIDKAFVLELDQSPDDLQIVRSTIDLGHNLGLRIVAEGVENQRSFELLRKYGCDKAQGYHFAKPLPALEFEQWCTSFNSMNNATVESGQLKKHG